MIDTVHKALFPGVLAGILCLLMFVSIANNPPTVLAADEATPEPAADEIRAEDGSEPTQEPLSPFDLIASIFAPLIQNNPPTGEQAPNNEVTTEASAPNVEISGEDSPNGEDSSNEETGEQAVSEGCALGGGYAERVRGWCDLIENSAANHGLDPNLIAAVMSVESGGNPDAYSRNGAVGLMQVMPRDGLAAEFICPNGPCFAKRPSMAELFDPSYNLDFAAAMLSGLYNRHGSWRDALRAYGPAGVGYAYADKVLGVYENNR
jgi:hypothetical protein